MEEIPSSVDTAIVWEGSRGDMKNAGGREWYVCL